MYWYALCGRAKNTPLLKPDEEKVTFSCFSPAKRKENCVFHVLAWNGRQVGHAGRQARQAGEAGRQAGHGMCVAVHTLIHIRTY